MFFRYARTHEGNPLTCKDSMQVAVQTAIKSCRMIKVSALHLEFQPSLSEGGIGVQLFFFTPSVRPRCDNVVLYFSSEIYPRIPILSWIESWDQVERASIAVSMTIPACPHLYSVCILSVWRRLWAAYRDVDKTPLTSERRIDVLNAARLAHQ